MKNYLSILFILLFVGGTAAPLIEFDVCGMPCCNVEIESCCQVEKQMDCKMEMANCDSRILLVLPSAPLNKVNQDITPIIQELALKNDRILHGDAISPALNQALIPEPPPAFNLPLLI